MYVVGGLRLSSEPMSLEKYEGTVTLLGQTCAAARVEGQEHVLIWPRGTTVRGSGDSAAFDVGAATVKVGDRITFRVASSEPATGFDLPQECNGPGPLLQVQDLQRIG